MVDLRTPIGELPRSAFIVGGVRTGRKDVVVLQVRGRLAGWAVVAVSFPGIRRTRRRIVPANHSVERIASRELRQRALRVWRAVDVTWGTGSSTPYWRHVVGLAVCLAAVIILALTGSDGWWAHLVLWPALLGLVVYRQVFKRIKRTPRATRVGSQDLRLLWRQPMGRDSLSIGSVDPPGSLTAAIEHVDEVKAEYGQLPSNVVYRIENSALFDPAVEATRVFTLLLAQWDERAALPADAVIDLAHQLRLSFRAARDNAEALGMGHLPRTSHRDARRAVKALRLAERATTDGERAAAIEQASRILSSLAIYYLPNPEETRRALGGGRPAVER